MKNKRGTYITQDFEKNALINQCVKRYFKGEAESYSYGSNKIPIIDRKNFKHNSDIISLDGSQSDSDPSSNSESSGADNNDDDDDNDSDNDDDNVNISISNCQINDIFSDRKKKYSNRVFPLKNKSPILSEVEEISQGIINEIIGHSSSIECEISSLNGNETDFSNSTKCEHEGEIEKVENITKSRRKIRRNKHKKRKRNIFILDEAYDATNAGDHSSETDENQYDRNDPFIDDSHLTRDQFL